MIKEVLYCDYCEGKIEKGEEYYKFSNSDMCKGCNMNNRRVNK